MAHRAQSQGSGHPALRREGMRGRAGAAALRPKPRSPLQTAQPSPDPQCHDYCNISDTRVHMSLQRYCLQDYGEWWGEMRQPGRLPRRRPLLWPHLLL